MCLSNRAPSCGGAIATLQSPYTPHSAWTGQVFFTNEPYPTGTTSCNEGGRNGSRSSSNNAQTTTIAITTTTSVKYQWETPIPRSRTCSSISTSSSNSIPSTADTVCRLRIHEFAHDPLSVHNAILHDVLLRGGDGEEKEEVVNLGKELVLGVGGKGIIGRGISIVIVGGVEEEEEAAGEGEGEAEDGKRRVREGEVVGWGVIGWN